MVTITPQHRAMNSGIATPYRRGGRRSGGAQTNYITYRYGDNIFVQESETIAMLYWQRRQEEYDELAKTL
jgi:hypothetical protein